jgi:hypothetical protein
MSCVAAWLGVLGRSVLAMVVYRHAVAWWEALTETPEDARLREWQRIERDARGW